MQFLFAGPTLSTPTFEDFKSYAELRFKKIERLLTRYDAEFRTIRVSIDKEGRLYKLVVELNLPGDLVITAKDRDFRRALDAASKQLKIKLRRDKDRITNRKKYGFKSLGF